MKIDKVILSSDLNEDYLGFWNIVSKAWKELIDIEPVLYVISDKEIEELSEEYGKVYYHSPVEGVETKNQAQIIRHFATTNFPNDVCIISDIDMMPLNKKYYNKLVENVSDEKLVVYSADAYPPGTPSFPSYPMCYVCAKGSTFESIIGANINNFSTEVHKWMEAGHGWWTDERYFYTKWSDWDKKNGEENTVLYGRGFNHGPPITIHRIDRSEHPYYDHEKLQNGNYIDYHMPRPYGEHKGQIDKIYKIAKETNGG